MKKCFMILVCFVCFGINSYSQPSTSASCKVVNPSREGATVVGYIVNVDEDGYANLSFSSDEPMYRVNIQYTVEYMYKSPTNANASSYSKEGAVGVDPNKSVSSRVFVGKGIRPHSLKISGAQCIR